MIVGLVVSIYYNIIPSSSFFLFIHKKLTVGRKHHEGLKMSANSDDKLSHFIQVSVCSRTTRIFLDSVSQMGQRLRLAARVFVTMETLFAIMLYPAHLNCQANASFTLQMTSVVQFSIASTVVSHKKYAMTK